MASSNMDEPIKTLNGRILTPGQGMALRVALESFASSLQDEGLGDDDTGKAITKGYLKNIEELRKIIY